jgi:spore germination protein GerM
MRRDRAGLAVLFVAFAAVLAWVLFAGIPRWATRRAPRSGTTASAPAAPGRKIKARLFYVAESGQKLAGAEREVAYGDGTIEQAKEILEAQIAPSVEPYMSAIPPGTTLRAVYLAPGGAAYVDFSGDISRAHPGGTLNELLTIYTIVDVLSANLPAVTSVQILVDGKQVDTLAGHVDLRSPLTRNLDIVE